MKNVIIIADGKKSEFNSEIPTVFHEIIDKPMIKKVVDNFNQLGFETITTIVDKESESLLQSLLDESIYSVTTDKKVNFDNILPLIKNEEGITVITRGTTPLITSDTYSKMIESVKEFPMVVLTSDERIVDDQDIILRNPAETIRSIVKYEEATADQKMIKEVNMNVYVFNNKMLYNYLSELRKSQASITIKDVVTKFKEYGHAVLPYRVSDPLEAMMIRNRRDLVVANEWEKRRINNYWLDQGVTIFESDSVTIGNDVSIGMDTIIWPNNIILGSTLIGENNEFLSGNTIVDTTIGDRNKIDSSKIVESIIEDDNDIGPWTNLRTGSTIGKRNRIGSSVELKKTTIKNDNALAHNVYLGNTTVGSHCNIGWGVVTANFDGVNKNETVIGDHSFIGSSSTIIAPVSLGDTVLIAAGSVINQDVPSGDMGIGRAQQVNKKGKGKKHIEREE